MIMDHLLFYVVFGGAALILIYGGIQIRRRYPRIKHTEEPRGFTETEWREIVKSNEVWCEQERERERIQRQDWTN